MKGSAQLLICCMLFLSCLLILLYIVCNTNGNTEKYEEKTEPIPGCPICPPCRIPGLSEPRIGYIFLSVASFRDERCTNTIEEAFKQANDPTRLVLGICEQNAQEIEKCIKGPVEKGEVRVISIPADWATGPATARQRVSSLWQGEEIYVQIDAHTFFAPGWDNIVRKMWSLRPDDRSVFSTYPVNAVGMDRDHDFSNDQVPVLSKGWFTTKNEYLQSASTFHNPGEITTSRSIGGGCIIASGKVLVDVPLDPTVVGLFQGEECLWCARMFTNGYNFYSPSHNIVSHLYERKREEAPVHQKGTDFSAASAHCWDLLRGNMKNKRAKTSVDRGYGFGKVRSLKDFWKHIKIDPSGEITGKDSQEKWDYKIIKTI